MHRLMMNFMAAVRSIKSFIAELNLFETAATRSNPEHLRTAIISTRFYIILLTIAVGILVIFTALGQQTQTIIIRKPSQEIFEQLNSKYSTTLQCPCNQIEIPYNIFINTSYKLHPVCSSVFVSDSWINLLFSPNIGFYFPLDFRSSASGQFQILTSLCSFVNITIQDAIDDFLSNTLLSPDALSSVSFNNQSEALSQFLRTSTTSTFLRLLNLVSDTTGMNGLQPAMQTNMMHLLHIYPNNSIDVWPYQTIWGNSDWDYDNVYDYENYEYYGAYEYYEYYYDYYGAYYDSIDDTSCFCGVTSQCFSASGFFDLYAFESQGYFVPPIHRRANATGFQVGCFALNALLNSSLECFFDSNCFNTVLSFFPKSNITSLDILNINQTQYAPQTTIGELVNKLFIEHWSSQNSFSAYYSQCAPVLCTYKLTEHNSILHILTTLLGLYGGLTIVLRTFVPGAVYVWRNRKILFRGDPNTRKTLLQRFQRARQWIKVQIIKLNLFKTETTDTDIYELKTGIITTRIYLLSMVLALGIITIYLLLSLRVYTITVQNPSRTTFENLYNKYTSTLQCPCSQIAIPYESFSSLSPKFHPVCSSVFISSIWINYISSANIINSNFDDIDFRVAGPTFFNSLITLCSLSNSTVNDAWYSFIQTPLITDLTIVESEFKARSNVSIEQFKQNTISEVEAVLSLVDFHTRTMYTTNYLNTLLVTDQLANTGKSIDFDWEPVVTNTCSCALISQCNEVMSFFNYTNKSVFAPYSLQFTLPDIFVGCYVVSSTLQSSLSCFFNQTCLNMIQHEIYYENLTVPILDVNATRFSPETSIGTLLDNLMIEIWNDNVDYDQYYKQCAPQQCTYTYASHNNALQILITLIGLFGGLSTALKIIVQFVVSWIRNRLRRQVKTSKATSKPC